jgi:hypothetical protein
MWRAALCVLLGAGSAAAQPPALSPPWLPDTFLYLGNIVRGLERDHLLAALELHHDGRFEIHLAESDDDGHSWRFAGLAARDPSHDLYDPAMVRLPDGALLLEYHGGHVMTILRSTDDGASWSPAITFLGLNTEGFWREIPGRDPGSPPRVALLYTVTHTDFTSTYWIRATTDGFHWTDAMPVGDAGAIWDGSRAALGPVENDSGGILHAVYSYRQLPTDSVSLMVVSLDAHTLERRSAPVVVGKTVPAWRGIGVFPVLVACPEGDHVIYSDYAVPNGPRVVIMELTRGHPPAPFLERGPMYTGFGRVWFVPSWSGIPELAWPELPYGPHTNVFSTPRPDLAHCRT